MATRGSNASADKHCPQCGSTYAVEYLEITSKDDDSANCEVCGIRLDRWNSTRCRIYTLKERGHWPKQNGIS